MKITKEYLKNLIKEEIQKINEMALYFDSDNSEKEYTEVIRVDKFMHGKMLGPNSMMTSDMSAIIDGDDDESINKRFALSDKLKRILARAEKQPAPAKDFDPTEWEPVTWANRKKARTRNTYFAFPNIEAAEEWFGQKQLQQLIDIYGFNIRSVKAKKVWISKTSKQLIFEPLTDLKNGKVIR